ncbi:MAG: hypothetical protein HY809_01575 [Nitrospirae bacterium]|nr:hypothetical protein [Nitrospirota bacterium]
MMRFALNFLAVIIGAFGLYAIYGGFGENIMKALYSEESVTQQMIVEILYFSIGIIFICFSVTWVGLAYTLKKLKIIKDSLQK